jgi:hypothetical protein
MYGWEVKMDQGQELMGHGRSLLLGATIGLIVMIGTLFDILGSFKTPGRGLETLMRGRPPIVPLHEWTIDVTDEDSA